MKRTLSFGLLAIVLVFGMTVVGCDDGSTNNNEEVNKPSFPSGFNGVWKRDNFANTLRFTSTTLKASNQSSTWNLTGVSGDSYTIATDSTSGPITITFVNGNLEITGDSGTDENNWNGTWKPQPSFPLNFEGTWKRDNFDNTLTFNQTTLKASNQSSTWNLTDVSGNSYTIASGSTSGPITITFVNGNLEITGDSGSGENNWNGTWKPQP
ncbi:MAG: hypothetical protein LBV17_01215 [Treponema sp.]|jgi:hypothetical protein|nr:hypothetical protein [Treponema sp.]